VGGGDGVGHMGFYGSLWARPAGYSVV
jgi:hypothetical protein